MSLNKHGLNMYGLKQAAGMTRDTRGVYGPYIQVAYNTVTGNVLASWHESTDSCTRYLNEDVIAVDNYFNPASMQDIADAIKRAVDSREALRVRAAANPPAKIAANNRYTTKTYKRVTVNLRHDEDAELLERIAAVADEQGISEGAAIKVLLQKEPG